MSSYDAPLADRMRPRRLNEFVGQRQLLGPETLLRNALERDQLFSMIFWGPPGSGKPPWLGSLPKRQKHILLAFLPYYLE